MTFKELELRSGEKLLLEGAASKWQKIGSKGGKLFLTNQRIVFKAHGFNFGSKIDEYELSQINAKNNTFEIFTSSNLASTNITFHTNNGEKLSFVVTNKQKNMWIEQISNAIKDFSFNEISMPTNIPETKKEEIKSQIKVVQCQGCGACVVIYNQLAFCEYCGRPTVG